MPPIANGSDEADGGLYLLVARRKACVAGGDSTRWGRLGRGGPCLDTGGLSRGCIAYKCEGGSAAPENLDPHRPGRRRKGSAALEIVGGPQTTTRTVVMHTVLAAITTTQKANTATAAAAVRILRDLDCGG